MLVKYNITWERGQRERANNQIDFDLKEEYTKSQIAIRLVANVLASGNAGEAPGRASQILLSVDRPLYDVLLVIDKIVAKDNGAGIN